MIFSDNLYSRLNTDAAITALVSTRIYPNKLPQGTGTKGAIRYAIRGETVDQVMGQTVGFRRVRYQIDSFAGTYRGAEAIDDAVYTRLSRWRDIATNGVQDVYSQSLQTFYDDETEQHRFTRIFEFIINE